ncbi:MAG: hypothetical protein AVDCRST_MAG78-1034 [uncultured Rubrobacteraceae bacterium]|uniref:Uncharacterized protein n=1 Tax=uncultured Rubrobacteraceae bacterium TaxID=349277 RepID=A0A6J4PMM3_9ACTN|nr:MAG: hypothetical protein AVDCRST_MAG78-1034 [uncultured Rubrobacteraceae bacterium]
MTSRRLEILAISDTVEPVLYGSNLSTSSPQPPPPKMTSFGGKAANRVAPLATTAEQNSSLARVPLV